MTSELESAEGKLSALELLFSESNSRYVLACAPEQAEKLEKLLKGIPFAKVGVVGKPGESLDFKGSDVSCALNVSELVKNYKAPLAGV